MQTDELEFENVPVPQEVHDGALTSEKKPAEQPRQAVEAEALWKYPAEHELQDICAEEAWKRPGEHALQLLWAVAL